MIMHTVLEHTFIISTSARIFSVYSASASLEASQVGASVVQPRPIVFELFYLPPEDLFLEET